VKDNFRFDVLPHTINIKSILDNILAVCKKANKSFIFLYHFFLGYIFLKNVDQKKKKSMNSLWRVSEPQTNNWFEKLITLFFRANWVIEGRNLIKNYCLWITMGTFNLSLLLLLFFSLKKSIHIFEAGER
jgi:hypothetical protein